MSQIQQQQNTPKKTESISNTQTSELDASEWMPPTLQRSIAPQEQITPQNVLYLQRAIGNAAVQRLVRPDQARTRHTTLNIGQPQTTPAIQRKLSVGPANDKYEREADDISKQVVRRTLADQVQRDTKNPVGPEGGEVDKGIENSIRNSTGGSSMPKGVRQAIEPKLGADLSNVKVHTDSGAADLNRQLGAKAFTHKNHIYYGKGQSPSDVKLTAHEAVHTVQQGATQINRKAQSELLQRTYKHPDTNKFYSHILAKQEITANNGVITATATGGPGGGHTILIFEYLDGGTGAAKTKKIDLTAGGAAMSSGKASGNKGPASSRSTTLGTTGSENVTSGSTSSQSSTTESIQINMGDASTESLNRIQSSQKRSWVVTKNQIEVGLAEAINVKDDMIKNVGKYSYKLFGRSLFAKNAMNCASFGERVLQKAGIKASATSWWFGTKLPSTLASGQNEGYTPDASYQEPRRPSTPTPPTPVRAPVRGVDATQFDHIKDLAYRRVTFLDGKVIAGETKEFDYKKTPDDLFTFRTDPVSDTDLPLTMFKITVHKDLGLGRLEPPSGEGKVKAVYVLLSDLFTSTGALITA